MAPARRGGGDPTCRVVAAFVAQPPDNGQQIGLSRLFSPPRALGISGSKLQLKTTTDRCRRELSRPEVAVRVAWLMQGLARPTKYRGTLSVVRAGGRGSRPVR